MVATRAVNAAWSDREHRATADLQGPRWSRRATRRFAVQNGHPSVHLTERFVVCRCSAQILLPCWLAPRRRSESVRDVNAKRSKSLNFGRNLAGKPQFRNMCDAAVAAPACRWMEGACVHASREASGGRAHDALHLPAHRPTHLIDIDGKSAAAIRQSTRRPGPA